MSHGPNGSRAHGPLHLTPKQRHALLASHNMAEGWLLLTLAEMLKLRQTMVACQQENDRLNAELAKAVAANVTAKNIAEKVARWILVERAKMIVGKSAQDHADEIKSPPPVSLWRCAQELVGDTVARGLAAAAENEQRKNI